MEIREALPQDLAALLHLYTQLHHETAPSIADAALPWQRILHDPDHHVLFGMVDGQIVTTCVLLIVPNLTRGAHPYAVIENVVTDAAHRNLGYATQLMEHACTIAKAQDCYKVMLTTSRRDPAVLRFYANAGFDPYDKTAFVLRINRS